MKNKATKLFISVALIFVAIVSFVACKNNNVSDKEISSLPDKEISLTNIYFFVDDDQYCVLTYSDSFELPSAPQKDGYLFAGWFFDDGAWQNPFNVLTLSDDMISDTEEIKIYARFVIYVCEIDGNQHEFEKITLKPNGCLVSGKEKYQCKHCTYFYEQITAPTGHNEVVIDSVEATCTENGYIKYKCSNCQNERTLTVSAEGHSVDPITRECSHCDYAENFVITFNTDGGTPIEKHYVKYNQLISGEIVTTKDGYIFSGWKNGLVNFNIATDTITKDITLTAQWKIISHVVFSESSEPNREIIFGTSFSLPTIEKTGYTFGGWSYNGIKITSAIWDIEQSNVTLEPIFTPNKYTVEFQLNSGSIKSTTMKVTFGEKVQLPVPTNGVGIFDGWYYGSVKISDGNGLSLTEWNIPDRVILHDLWIKEVSCVNDFEDIRNNTESYITWKLTNDIVMAKTPWNPIQYFMGVFDGNGHSIDGLVLTADSMTTSNDIGLFGTLDDGATVKNLTLTNVDAKIEDVNKTYSFGIIAGRVGDKASIKQCTVNGNVVLTKQGDMFTIYAGGICGKIEYESVDISFCKNNACISGGTYTAGIIGYVRQLSLSDCENNANISNADYGAGIICYSAESVEVAKCKNAGDISAYIYAGGIVGGGKTIYVDQAVNYGDITVSDMNNSMYGVGGIVGSTEMLLLDKNPTVSVSHCYNIGRITGLTKSKDASSGNAGGIIGFSYEVEAYECYNVGFIDGTNYAGGIAGLSIISNVTECLNIGEVSGVMNSAITYNDISGTISGCYYFNSQNYEKANATKTVLTKEKDFYIKSLLWEEYNESEKTGYWVFHENSYPTLFFEKGLEKNSI
ncbi:MAG: InlB B-repeat-containing protein [Clostridia bacterium]|nr:InlB B-repeat-containing protein [Clostridia bacterium]